MAFNVFGRRDLASVDDLRRVAEKVAKERPVAKLRERVRILVIDDEAFAPIENLSRHHYQIHKVDDISDIYNVEPYQIVLCDLKGVGITLNPKMQGAHVIKEIKNNYPEKFVIAYTGGSEDRLVQESITIADKYVPKDTDIEDWCETLDSVIRELSDPVQSWKKVRHRLLDRGLNPNQLALIEDAYVRNFSNGEAEAKKGILQVAEKFGFGSDARAIINSLISSLIFALLFG